MSNPVLFANSLDGLVGKRNYMLIIIINVIDGCGISLKGAKHACSMC